MPDKDQINFRVEPGYNERLKRAALDRKHKNVKALILAAIEQYLAVPPAKAQAQAFGQEMAKLYEQCERTGQLELAAIAKRVMELTATRKKPR